MNDEQNEAEFTEEDVGETFTEFSIDEGLEQRFNTVQTFVEQGKIHYHAYIQARRQRLEWLDQD